MKSLLTIPIPQNRIFGLDLLRAAAILFVLIMHSLVLLPPAVEPVAYMLLLDGVSIFFVLSGFLIGGILLRNFSAPVVNAHTLLHFWVRRWARTLPAYFLVLTFLCCLYVYSKPDFSMLEVAPSFFFSQNLFSPHAPVWFFMEAWSISIEEWFYLITPVLLWIGIKVGKQTLTQAVWSVVVLVITATIALRMYRWATVPPEGIEAYVDVTFRKQVSVRLDNLMWGVAAACIYRFHPGRWQRLRKLNAVAGLVLLLIVRYAMPRIFPGFSLYLLVFSSTINALAIVLLLPFLVNWKRSTGFLALIITRLSLISYSAYLLNLSVVILLLRRLPWNQWLPASIAPWVAWIVFWTLTITLSTLLYKYFELPMMKLRDHPRMKRLFAPPANN